MGIFGRGDEQDLSDMSELRAGGSVDEADDADGGEAPQPEVEYDLSAWTSLSRSMLTTSLDRADLAHVWQDDVLVVLAVDEARTDALVEEVQASSEDVLDALEPLPLPPGAPIDEYDLSDWSEARRREVHRRLCFATIPFALEAGAVGAGGDDGEDGDIDAPEGVTWALLTLEEDRMLVEHVLDGVEFPDALPEAADQPEDRPDLPPAMEVLSDLYVAADRIKSNARDAKAVTSAIASVEDLVELTMPYGYDVPQWEALIAEADVLWELLVDGGELDDIEDSAKRLRDRLHPLV